jgi:cytochrome b
VEASARQGRVWDLPTRIFHWTLATLVVCSVVSAKLGGLWLEWHMRSGYAILSLLAFRLLWGFAGSRTARFAGFVRGPRAVMNALRGGGDLHDGHSAAGGWSVLAMLAVLLAQATTGLFANDGSFMEGPLARLVAGASSDLASTVHRYGEWALYALVGLHLAAIAYYGSVQRKPLVRAMVTGDRPGVRAPTEDDALTRLRALLLAALASGLVGYVVTL